MVDVSTSNKSQVDRACSCGHHYGIDDSNFRQDNGDGDGFPIDSSALPSVSRAANRLEASFVHLSSSLTHQPHQSSLLSSPKSNSKASKASNGFLDSYRHLQILERAVISPQDPPRLCLLCLKRVEMALDADTDRLEQENHAYKDAMREEEARCVSWKRALEAVSVASASHNTSPQSGNDNDDDNEYATPTTDAALERTEQEFRNEIHALREACQQQEAEISHLLSLQKEQALALQEIEQLEYAMEEEHNSLELEARAFDNDQEQLYRTLAEVQDEVSRLSSPQIRLPFLLFNLQVDKERGLRYPLINDLRLAYRPKGDVQWNEIQVAWSLAAQLLLSIGTLFKFQSVNWKLVPLSHCAKLIYLPCEGDQAGNQHKRRAVVYNLGHPRTDGSKALLAWNALLHQVILHATVKLHHAVESGLLESSDPPLPFEITATKIGNIVLGQLGAGDDPGWSKAIHFMSCNLLWLSECASGYVRQKVLLTTIRAIS